MPDMYDSFAELSAEEEGGYFIQVVPRPSPVAVLAVHGGLIEPRTAEIAEALACDDLSLYTFRGIKAGRNKTLHLRSDRFDEEQGLAVVESAEVAVSLHGCRDRTGERGAIYVGGRHTALKQACTSALRAAGFAAMPTRESHHPDVRVNFRGASPANICNRCRGGRGLQLELAQSLRRELLPWINDGYRPQPRLADFVRAVRQALVDVLEL